MSEKTLAFLDIETTGLSPNDHEVLEVAYVLDHVGGAYTEDYFSLPIYEHRADPQALKVNRYWERRDDLMQVELSPFAAAAKLKRNLEDCIIVGANPAFDTAFLGHFLWQHCITPPWYYRSVDINTLAAGWLKHPLPLSTAEVAQAFEVPLSDDQHTALADARWNRAAYKAIISA